MTVSTDTAITNHQLGVKRCYVKKVDQKLDETVIHLRHWLIASNKLLQSDDNCLESLPKFSELKQMTIRNSKAVTDKAIHSTIFDIWNFDFSQRWQRLFIKCLNRQDYLSQFEELTQAKLRRLRKKIDSYQSLDGIGRLRYLYHHERQKQNLFAPRKQRRFIASYSCICKQCHTLQALIEVIRSRVYLDWIPFAFLFCHTYRRTRTLLNSMLEELGSHHRIENYNLDVTAISKLLAPILSKDAVESTQLRESKSLSRLNR